MAAMRTLTVAGLFLAFCALGLIAIAISTDNWYETDARRNRERCKNYSNKRNPDPGYIYISNNNLPLRMLPKEKNVERKGSSVSGEMLLRAKRHFLPPAPVMESLCSRQFNSTITGLWRKCHREGFDLETEDLIFKGLFFVVGEGGHNCVIMCLFWTFVLLCEALSVNTLCTNALSKVLMLHLQRMTASFIGMAISIILFGWIIGVLGCCKEHDLMQYVAGLLFLMGGTCCIISLCTCVAGINFELSRYPRYMFGIPEDISHGYGWAMFCAWGGLGLTLLAGFLCTLAPSLYPPHSPVVHKPRQENGCV
ncbi:transmembrane protein 178B-like [Seriola lalandi dorsalis]|uniref:transmembrane protein 178B-like n=1 Tax=Seriola lalandi dorsalis TaxID=1841481 RepID=UPI000C6F5A28|nr:transmembrane protein 178B-like [Seriola lalandi dorsalis]